MPIDMFIDPERDPRVDAPPQGDERATLVAFLAWQRGTLELKCSGLDAADLARRAVEPWTLSGNDRWRGAVSLRFVLVHMIEEYARHNGQADLLRQRIDGAVGQ